MTSSYEWGPDDHAWKTIGQVFALPVKDAGSYARSARAFAGRHPLKWLLVVLGAVGYGLGVLVYWLFALFPAGSYVFLWILALPFVVAVYAVKGGAALLRRGRAATAPTAASPTPTPTSTPTATTVPAGPTASTGPTEPTASRGSLTA